MDLSLSNAKKITLNDQQIMKFNDLAIKTLRWKLPDEEKSEAIVELQAVINFLHSQYLYQSSLSVDLLYQLILGDRLHYDPNYIRRILLSQRDVGYGKLPSIMADAKLKAIYPKFLLELFSYFENPENDKKIIKVSTLLDKWSM